MNRELETDTHLSHYRIVSKIGAGGMGEVYRAHDARLDREVAIKVLPSDLLADKDRLQRFEQEAKATSTLNHPNILTVYDVGEHEGSPFIVSELLEGEELRDRLDKGPIPLRQVTEFSKQIVNGLSAAHEKGIVHRDLKPENIFITRDERVKILDFGLAKLRGSSGEPHGSEDATRKAITNPGMVMGTAGYMSPEQVRGQPTDHRSDIFSFGAILHEMITGRRAFRRETMAETMSAILKEEPAEISESTPNISPSLERIVRRCLEKKPERRFQSASDLGFALESLTMSSGVRPVLDEAEISPPTGVALAFSSGRGLMFAVVAALALAVIAAIAAWYVKPTPALPVRLLELPASIAAANRVALSPDGTRVAYILDGRLHVRALDAVTELDLGPIASSAVSSFLTLFWSPDSKMIGFTAEREIRTVPAGGGTVFVVGKIPATGEVLSAKWFRDGTIVFAVWRDSVYSVPAAGGTPVVAMAINPATEIDVHHISEAPNGRLIAEIHQRASDHSVIVLASRGSGNNQSRVVLTNDQTIHHVDYVEPGFVIFDRQKTNVGLWVAPFNGGPIDVAKATLLQTGAESADTANDSSLIFVLPAALKAAPVWVDRTGSVSTITGAPVRNSGAGFALSPDGSRVAMVLGGEQASTLGQEDMSLVVRDLTTGVDTRLTFHAIDGPGSKTNAVILDPSWFPSGDRILFSAGEVEAGRLLDQRSDEATPPREFAAGLSFGRIAHDGRTLAAIKDDRGRYHLMYAPVSADGSVGEARRVFQDDDPIVDRFDLSPDGRLVVYEARQASGQHLVFLSEFPTGNGQWQVADDAARPRFSPDGREIFYLKNGTDSRGQPTRTLMSRTVNAKPTIVLGAATALFGGESAALIGQQGYNVAPDGRRFLTLKSLAPAPGEGKRFLWMQNWLAAVKK